MNSETTNMIRVTDDVFIDGDNLIIIIDRNTGYCKCLNLRYIISLMNNGRQQRNNVNN